MITPYEAFKLLGDEDDIEIYDVRTAEQREGHVINGQIGVSVMGALSLPLDDLVGEAVHSLPRRRSILPSVGHMGSTNIRRSKRAVWRKRN